MTKPLVRIMRGIPGSGKSTLAKQWIESLPKETHKEQVKLFSADLFWGEAYAFDSKRIGQAHAWCFREYLKLLEFNSQHNPLNDPPKIMIVDNTNIRDHGKYPYPC